MNTDHLIDRLEMMDFMIRHREVYRSAPEDSKNPVYTWAALLKALAPQVRRGAITAPVFPKSVEIPGWVAEYLSEVGLGIMMLHMGIDARVIPTEDEKPERPTTRQTELDGEEEQKEDRVDPKDAMTRLPGVLRLRRDGWNAFRAAAADRDRIDVFRKFKDLCRSGLSAKDAETKLQEDLGLADDRSARRRIAEGRAIIAARAVRAKPTP